MITATFSGRRTVRALVMDKPENGISGICECTACEWRTFLIATDSDDIAHEIEQFATAHLCTKEMLLEQMVAAKMQEGAGVVV